MPSLGRKWGTEETATLLRMRSEGVKHQDIATAIGRTRRQVTEKLDALDSKAQRDDKRVSRNYGTQTLTAPEASIIERDHAYGTDRTYMAELMGDPRPGRSALDRSNK